MKTIFLGCNEDGNELVKGGRVYMLADLDLDAGIAINPYNRQY